jgi:hypothetical protein
MGNVAEPNKNEEPEGVRARKRVEEVVSQLIEKWSAVIGLTVTVQFREDVTEALHAFMRAHLATPGRWRWSAARKEYLRLAEDYAAVAQLLRPGGGVIPPLTFDPRFSALPPLWPDPPFLRTAGLNQFRTALTALTKHDAEKRVLDATVFEELARTARQYAKLCVDTGGRSPPISFDALWRGLKVAVEHATKCRATITWREDLGIWGGDLFRLVEAVWPVACEIAETITGRRALGPPTPSARGKHLQRGLKALTRRGR